MQERHMFAGVNSPKGFHSKFNHIMNEAPGKRKIFIKGGPGMGKSTLIKKVAKQAMEEGFICELFHCSSDPSSLDGLHIPALNFAIIDATAPHNFDPVYPCAGGELFDVSQYMEKDIDIDASESLVFYTEQKKEAFLKGQHYLQAALPLLRYADYAQMREIEVQEIYDKAEKLAVRFLENSLRSDSVNARELFISAISSEGFINYADTVFGETYCIALKGNSAASMFIRRFAEIAKMLGFAPIVFYCPMRPDEKIEHILIPKIGFSITTYDGYVQSRYDELINLEQYEVFIESTEQILNHANILMKRAIQSFSEAKKAHSRLEEIYISSMNFDRLSVSSEKLLRTIF